MTRPTKELEQEIRALSGEEGSMPALRALLAERVAEARRGGIVQGSVSEIAETVRRSLSNE